MSSDTPEKKTFTDNTPATSMDSLLEANRERGHFSDHGNALGAAGVKEESLDPENYEHLRLPGQSIAVNPGPAGFATIKIGVSWDNVALDNSSIIEGLVKKMTGTGIDLDLGCLYEMADGTRGAIQAFGEKYGRMDATPYMQLSGDERTGDKEGLDEVITINGTHWPEIKKIIVYLYIYGGTPNWVRVNPRVVIDVPGNKDLHLTLSSGDSTLPICAFGGLENQRGGIQLTNYTEYFAGHEEMDRAFGFGLKWEDSKK